MVKWIIMYLWTNKNQMESLEMACSAEFSCLVDEEVMTQKYGWEEGTDAGRNTGREEHRQQGELLPIAQALGAALASHSSSG